MHACNQNGKILSVLQIIGILNTEEKVMMPVHKYSFIHNQGVKLQNYKKACSRRTTHREIVRLNPIE